MSCYARLYRVHMTLHCVERVVIQYCIPVSMETLYAILRAILRITSPYAHVFTLVINVIHNV